MQINLNSPGQSPLFADKIALLSSPHLKRWNLSIEFDQVVQMDPTIRFFPSSDFSIEEQLRNFLIQFYMGRSAPLPEILRLPDEILNRIISYLVPEEREALRALRHFRSLGSMEERPSQEEVLHYLLTHGSVPLAKWFAVNRRFLPSLFTSQAAAIGNLELVEWARQQGFEWGRAAHAAAQGGHLRVLQWMHAQGCSLD